MIGFIVYDLETGIFIGELTPEGRVPIFFDTVEDAEHTARAEGMWRFVIWHKGLSDESTQLIKEVEI